MDKVQKIREEVERLRSLHQINYQLLDTNDKMCLVECGMRNLCNDLLLFIDSLQEESVSDDLEKAAEQDVCEVVNTCSAIGIPNDHIPSWVQDAMVNEFIHGAKWQKEHLWKSANGDDLPEYEREVVVFTQDFPNDAGIMRIAIAHRPDPKGWDGKSITTGKIEHYTPKTYGKGGWNIPDVVIWLDLDIPKLEED